MRAVVITSYGGVEGIGVQKVDTPPSPTADRVWKVGDRVFGITGGGAQAEFVVVPESNLARIPAELDWVQAGAMPAVFITAHDALFTRADLHMASAFSSAFGETSLLKAHASVTHAS
jgi:NADPH2:quinone reductase